MNIIHKYGIMYLTKLVVLQINTKYLQNEKMDVEVKIGQSKM